MSKINNMDGSLSITDEVKENSNKHNLSKFDYDLYKDEDNKLEKLIRVKRTSLPNKGERWRLMEDNKVMLTIEGTQLNKKERDFFRSVDGINWLLAEYKSGIKSFNQLKKNLKVKLK